MNFIDELKEYLLSKTKEEVLKDWEETRMECLEQAIIRAKPNLDKIVDVDKHIDSIR
tara:strand:+ start:294 stop:464 length:171 start_codon:yes stop_codon:yes gene_type:complete